MVGKIDIIAATGALLIDTGDGRLTLVYSQEVSCRDLRRDVGKEARTELRRHLEKSGSHGLETVCITQRAVCKHFGEVFWLEHSAAYQAVSRIRIGELRVPASLLMEEDARDGDELVRREALFRLRRGEGVLVFCGVANVRAWMKRHDIDFESHQHLFVEMSGSRNHVGGIRTSARQ
ncbi:hypothetical protein T281_12430 [Rhodomicrobium udaipurense JA643]|uniref:Uncharacterized protein n=1 Tax=Rhodomicrobium udaipurense TaxID=1202716 RepID=A0A8I1KG56_9HYPH|nr:hypothetical protein [Rhodomicrobium udaipurense]KAI94175.1 hypothetical protein T281_12430 [Rhodomicrobium udaipurense JA643]MBJ7542395.1 hypothetical protein [Rhodomicrobium udaipurense]